MPIMGKLFDQRRNTPALATWRTSLIFCAALAAIAGGGWLGSWVVAYDDRLGMAAVFPGSAVVGALTIGWLRSRKGFFVAPFAGILFAGLALSNLLHDNARFVGGRLQVSHTGSAVFEESMLAIGGAVALVGIVCAAVGGYLHPRGSED